MALDIKKAKRKLNFTAEKKEVYVATADRGGVIDTEKMAKEIAVDTGARPAQVKMILDTLTDRIVAWLEEGHGVRLGNLGSFLPAVRSKSGETADEAEVTKVRIAFYPNRKLASRVASININTVSDGSSSSDATDGGSTGSGSTDSGSTDSGEGGQELE